MEKSKQGIVGSSKKKRSKRRQPKRIEASAEQIAEAIFAANDSKLKVGKRPKAKKAMDSQGYNSLFLEVQDRSGHDSIEITGRYHDYDLSNRSEWQSWKNAYDSISLRKKVAIQEILASHPRLAVADWAHTERIQERLGAIFNFDSEQLDADKDEFLELVDELLSCVKHFLVYREALGAPTSSEPFPGYWDFGPRKAAESLGFAVEALEYFGSEEQLRVLSATEDLFPENEEVRALRKKIEAVDRPFELAFKDLVSGESIDINDYRGKVVVIDFWATWCQPCLDFLPQLKSLLRIHQNQDVKIIGVSCDEAFTYVDGERYLQPDPTQEEQDELEQRVLKCIKTHDICWPVFIDQSFHEQWAVKSIPTIFVIDRTVRLRNTNAAATLHQTVHELLND